MNINRLFRTVTHLKPIQIAYQVKARIFTPKYVQIQASEHAVPVLKTEPIPRNGSLKGEEFTFLNLSQIGTMPVMERSLLIIRTILISSMRHALTLQGRVIG